MHRLLPPPPDEPSTFLVPNSTPPNGGEGVLIVHFRVGPHLAMRHHFDPAKNEWSAVEVKAWVATEPYAIGSSARVFQAIHPGLSMALAPLRTRSPLCFRAPSDSATALFTERAVMSVALTACLCTR